MFYNAVQRFALIMRRMCFKPLGSLLPAVQIIIIIIIIIIAIIVMWNDCRFSLL